MTRDLSAILHAGASCVPQGRQEPLAPRRRHHLAEGRGLALHAIALHAIALGLREALVGGGHL
eukprot:2336364-Heterocapsa_arctica.AAC.1